MATLAISNIAWPADRDDDAYALLREREVHLEVAPTRIWPEWQGFSAEAAAAQPLGDAAPRVRSLQALLYARDDLALFSRGEAGRGLLMQHLRDVIDAAAALCAAGADAADRAPALVFGSPRQRRVGDCMPLAEAERVAVQFFRAVGEYACSRGVVFCLEPNPVAYKADFMTNAQEAAAIVRRVAHAGVRLTLDSGCMHLAGDNVCAAIVNNADILHHFQVAEPQLGTFASPAADHERVAMALFAINYAGVISVEMRPTGEESLQNASVALDFVRRVYACALRRTPRVAIVGGGWYGCHLALRLRSQRAAVRLYEARDELFTGASSNNQFRLHLGFHYPRSYATRNRMQSHYYRFACAYGPLVDDVVWNFYAVAKNDSLLDFGTYTAVMRSMGIPYIVLNPADYGVQNVEGMVATREMVFRRREPAAFFSEQLAGLVTLKRKITPADISCSGGGDCAQTISVKSGGGGNSPAVETFDYLIDCTYNHGGLLRAAATAADAGAPAKDSGVFYEVCLSLVYADLESNQPEMALTIMDGKLCSLYPLRDSGGGGSGNSRRLVTLTSVEHTPVAVCASAEEAQRVRSALHAEDVLRERRPLFERLICKYLPSFATRYSYHGHFFSFKTKPRGSNDDRHCFVEAAKSGAPLINVWSGKINAIFEAEASIARLVSVPMPQTLGASAALIGYTGFVGSNLARQGSFSDVYNSKNIRDIRGREFDVVFCAGAPGIKWKANKFPAEDAEAIDSLKASLEGVQAGLFVLISTIDVYPVREAHAEDFLCASMQHHAYGRHRLQLEDYVLSRFENALVVRLPALFGPGLKKNYLYDLIANNNVDRINPNSKFQWYDVKDLMDDVTTVLARNHLMDDRSRDRVRVVNLFPEPVHTSDIIDTFFPAHAPFTMPRTNELQCLYDLHTLHGNMFASRVSRYIRTREEIMQKMGHWVKSTTSILRMQ